LLSPRKKPKMKSKKTGKKAQMKIQQMAFMLIAVTLFFVLVGLFFVVFKFSGLKETATALEEKNAMLLVAKLANSPEFSCGRAYWNEKASCVDADKVMMLDAGKYSNFWGISNLKIRKVDGMDEILCSTGNYPNCNLIEFNLGGAGGFSVSNFVSLCRKEVLEGDVYDKCEGNGWFCINCCAGCSNYANFPWIFTQRIK